MGETSASAGEAPIDDVGVASWLFSSSPSYLRPSSTSSSAISTPVVSLPCMTCTIAVLSIKENVSALNDIFVLEQLTNFSLHVSLMLFGNLKNLHDERSFLLIIWMILFGIPCIHG